MSKTNRRQFISNTSASLAGLGLFSTFSSVSLRALAAGLEGRESSAQDLNVVVFRAIGGMDSTLGLHPWVGTQSLSEKDLFLTYNPTRDVLNRVAGTNISLGLSAHCLAPFVNEMAIIRGVSMGASDIGHPAAIQYVTSARTSDTAPHMSAELAQKLTKAEQFFIANSSFQKSQKQNFSILLTESFKTLNIADLNGGESDDLFSLYKTKDLAVNRYINLLKQQNKLSVLSDVLAEMKNIKLNATSDATYGSQNDSSEQSLYDEDIVLASLVAGLTRVAQIDLIDESRNLDTHANHYLHAGYQTYRWQRIARFLKALQNKNLLQKTLVVVLTEFNRSPGRNENAGKDHNYTDNTIALFGAGIKGGTVIGDHQLHVSSARNPYSVWTGSFYDFNKQSVLPYSTFNAESNSDNAQLPEHISLIRPENVWATLLKQIDPRLISQFSVEPKTFKNLFKA